MTSNRVAYVYANGKLFSSHFLKKKQSMARSWSASKRDKIITAQFLDINPEKGKEMEKKRINEKISRKIQTKVDNCTEDRLNFYAEDRTRNRKRKRNADPCAQNSKRIDPCPRVRDSLFVRRYCTAKSFSLPRFNQARFWKKLPPRWRDHQKLFDPSSDNSITMIIG